MGALCPPRRRRPDELERAIGADLATTAVGESGILTAASEQAQQIDDPWLRSLAGERLDRARELVGARALPSAGAGARLASPWLHGGSFAVLVALTVAAAATRSHLLLPPLTVAVAVFAVVGGEHRRRESLPLLVCEQAAITTPQGTVVLPEPAVVASLASLASARLRVLRRARTLAAAGPQPARDLATARLTAAAALTIGTRPRTVGRSVLIWAVASAAAVVIEAL